MCPDEGTVYLLGTDDDADGDEWVTPEPADEVIAAAVVGATDLTHEDLEDLQAYVDLDDLAAVAAGDRDSLTFAMEGHDVTVDAGGDVAVE